MADTSTRPVGPFRDDMTLAAFQKTMRDRGMYITELRRYDTSSGKRPSEFVAEGTSYQHGRIVEYAEGNDIVDVLNKLATKIA